MLRSLSLAFQKWFALNKTALKTWAMLTEYLAIALIIGSLALLFWDDAPIAWLRIWGRRFGYLGLIMYWFSLLPGILQRLQLFRMMASLIMVFRRTLGALMFLFAVLHMMLSLVVPLMASGRAFTFTEPRIFGTIAIVLLFPLWLTSNDTSQRFMGKKWKMLQRLTYVALLFIFLHVAYFRLMWAVPTAVILGLEVVSWLSVWYKRRFQTPVSAQDGKISG